MDGNGTIDITDLVEKMRQTFVIWAVDYVFEVWAVMPGWQWLRLPVVHFIVKKLVELTATVISKAAMMQAFFVNTAIRKAAQAQEYLDAMNVKEQLPTTATDDEYEKAERLELAAFDNFVMVTR
jgi:hypothetical protein